MKVLVVGATGATGRLVVDQLLTRGHAVTAIVRSPERLPAALRNHDRLVVVCANLLDLSEADLARHLDGCDAIASCLGHTISVKGIYGNPRGLVAEATRRLCNAAVRNGSGRPVRFVLMNTTANRNRDLAEPLSVLERGVFCLVRLLLPPHVDNERAADYLRVAVGRDNTLDEWVVVRPDSLIDAEQVTGYEVSASPTRSPIFNAGSTSRINVAHFMADLLSSESAWRRWRGQMPVIYNKTTKEVKTASR